MTTTLRDEVLSILDNVGDDVAEAVKVIYRGPRNIAIYVLAIGLESMKSARRRQRRRELRVEVKPQFKAGRTTGSAVFTAATRERLLNHTRELFGSDGWMIGDLNLGDFTKEQLLVQAQAERASAKGSIRNAQFYEALAAPMREGQKAREFWKSEDARKIKDKIWKGSETRAADLV